MLLQTQRALTYIAGAEGFQVGSILGDVLGQVLLLCWSFQADFPLQQPHDVLFNQTGMDLLDDSLLGRRGGVIHLPFAWGKPCVWREDKNILGVVKHAPPNACCCSHVRNGAGCQPPHDRLRDILAAENFFVPKLMKCGNFQMLFPSGKS